MQNQTTDYLLLFTKRSFGVRSLRGQISRVIDSLVDEGPAVVTENGKPRAIIIDIEAYGQLLKQATANEPRLEGVRAEK